MELYWTPKEFSEEPRSLIQSFINIKEQFKLHWRPGRSKAKYSYEEPFVDYGLLL